MKTIKIEEINELMVGFISTKNERYFNEGYTELLTKYKPLITKWSSSFYQHDIQALFDDTIHKTVQAIEKDGGNFITLFNTSLYRGFYSLLRKKRTRKKYESYEIFDSDDEMKQVDFEDDFNLEDHVMTKRKADQLALIDFLASGENSRTTAIIRAYLTTEYKTPTAIGNYLGLNHKQVTRVLNRLAAKFNTTDQFGKAEDWLVA